MSYYLVFDMYQLTYYTLEVELFLSNLSFPEETLRVRRGRGLGVMFQRYGEVGPISGPVTLWYPDLNRIHTVF